jgi:hypothetical protein
MGGIIKGEGRNEEMTNEEMTNGKRRMPEKRPRVIREIRGRRFLARV